MPEISLYFTFYHFFSKCTYSSKVKFGKEIVKFMTRHGIAYLHRSVSSRWMLTFGFGLVHGFGFASVLRELGLPSAGLSRSLLSFNLGVEAGQIVIVALLWPALWLLNRRETRSQVWSPGFSRSWSSRLRLGTSAVIFLFEALWFCERTFVLKLLPV